MIFKAVKNRSILHRRVIVMLDIHYGNVLDVLGNLYVNALIQDTADLTAVVR